MKTNMEILYLLILVVIVNVLFTSGSFMLMKAACSPNSYTSSLWQLCPLTVEFDSLETTNNSPPLKKGARSSLLLKERTAKRLTKCFRSDDEILFNAERIRQGRLPIRNYRFEIIYTEQPLKQLVGSLRLR